MTDTTATINSKGLDGTGITEEISSDLFHKVGTHVMAIVDLQVIDKHGPSVNGKRKVTLIIDGIEPALDEQLAEHLRELQRTVYLNRAKHDGQMAIDDTLNDDEPTVDQVMAAGQQLAPHPYMASTLSTDDNAVCDVCGKTEPAPLHHAVSHPFATSSEPGDDEDQDAEPPAPDDATYDPHEFVGPDDGDCLTCDQPADAAVHEPTAA